jgi:hypothetical protein
MKHSLSSKRLLRFKLVTNKPFEIGNIASDWHDQTQKKIAWINQQRAPKQSTNKVCAEEQTPNNQLKKPLPTVMNSRQTKPKLY